MYTDEDTARALMIFSDGAFFAQMFSIWRFMLKG
jgi:hypothetical protein